ncbi:MAG: helix-turn-helix transcriptional regulator [Clostridiales bacterium]|jgi:transcriptional regulator with XRE-family HTH domain|nr:helix-turn-helix transcriptional regulator [Clostridiales bacterium]
MENTKTNDSNNHMTEKCRMFGKNMRATRKNMGITTNEMGKFLDLSPAYVGMIERGERAPSFDTFLKICDFFGESIDNMLSRKSPSSPSKSKTTAVEPKLSQKQKMLWGMISTFDVNELDYLIRITKDFKMFCERNQKADA